MSTTNDYEDRNSPSIRAYICHLGTWRATDLLPALKGEAFGCKY
jgi:hypothetical protein